MAELGTGEFFRRVIIVAAVVAFAVAVWELTDVLLLAFGAILVALMLQLIAEPIERWTPLKHNFALLVSGLIVLAIAAGTIWLFGMQIGAQMSDVIHRATEAVSSLRSDLGKSGLGRTVMSQLGKTQVSLTGWAEKILTVSIETIVALILLVISAAYLTSQPRLYRAGLVQLFPPSLHAEVGGTLDNIGKALRLWLLGQFIQMAIIGCLTLLAVWLIGLPGAMALGVIAGITEFIPYVGPVLAAIPAVLVAFTLGPATALWTVVAYLLIHQIEGNLVAPLIQRTMVSIPPALLLFVIAAAGALFGPLGILFAAPLTVVAFVSVKRLYVRNTLQQETDIPGEGPEDIDA
ncbi:MAG TPA: AI-2E family transporter [Hyphomicrobiales bacterium]|nr:AI-2E family transporter [Hyphomicrobiales bacterium]